MSVREMQVLESDVGYRIVDYCASEQSLDHALLYLYDESIG